MYGSGGTDCHFHAIEAHSHRYPVDRLKLVTKVRSQSRRSSGNTFESAQSVAHEPVIWSANMSFECSRIRLFKGAE